jgi:hypothetical protein
MKLRNISVTLMGAALAIGIFAYVGSVSHKATAEFTLGLGALNDLGRIGQPANVGGRDVGASTVLGGKMTWIFGDTLFAPLNGASITPADWRSATVGISPVSDPLAVNTPEDSRGVPDQTLPYTPAELAYNIAHHDPANNRAALWADSIISLNDNTGLIYYSKLTVLGSYKYDFQGIGTARINAGSTVASRNSNLLFAPNEPSYANAMVYNGMVYVYHCGTTAPYVNPCTIAVVPLDKAEQRSAYQFWDGKKWNSDINSARPVLEGAVAGMTVRWNPRIQKFIAVYMPAFTNTMYYRTADSPVGPWSGQQLLFHTLDPGPGGLGNYTSIQHTELSPDGNDLFVTYFRPGGTDALGNPGGIRLVKIPITNPPVANSTKSSTSITSSSGGSASTAGVKAPLGPAGTSSSGASGTAGPTVKGSSDTKAPVQVTLLGVKQARSTWLAASICLGFLIGLAGFIADLYLQHVRKHREFAHHFPFDHDLSHHH